MSTMKFTKLLCASVIFSSVFVTPSSAVTRVQKTLDKWVVACVDREQEEAKNRCTMSQSFSGVNQRNNRRVSVFQFSLTTSQDNKEILVMRTPLGVDINEKIKITFPGSEPVMINFDVCNQRGCFGETDMTDEWLNALRSFEKINASYKMRNTREIDVDLELSQFREAYDFFKESLESQ